MRSNRLQLNPAKTGVLWCTSARGQHLVPASPVNVCDTLVLPVRSVRDLGVHLDSDVSLRVHINLQVKSCFSVLRQIRSVRRSIPTTALLTLIRTLDISKVDYCISVLVGTSGHLLDRLQSVLNPAARLIFESRRSDYITSLLRKLHWLKIRERIQFRLCVLTFRCLNGTTLRYLADGLHSTTEVADRRCLRTADTTTLTAPATHPSSMEDRAFMVAASRSWNARPAHIRFSSSLLTFRRELKTWLFQSSYN